MPEPLSPATITEKNKPESEDILTFADIILDAETLHFVNNDVDINFFDYLGNAVLYYGLKMKRENKEESIDMTIQTLRIEVDNSDQALSYYASKNLRNKRVILRGCFRNLITDSANAWKIFDGSLNNPHWLETSFTAELVPRLGRGTLASKLGVKQQMLCRLSFAGTKCAHDILPAVLKDERTAQTVDTATTAHIIDATRVEADDYWNAGYITFAANTTTVSLRGVVREIKDFVSATHQILLKVSLPVAPAAGDTYTIERGCDLTLESCQNKFNNDMNYGGVHTLPGLMVVR